MRGAQDDECAPQFHMDGYTRADDHDVSRNMLVNPGRPSIRLPRLAILLERGCKQLPPPHRTMVDAFNF